MAACQVITLATSTGTPTEEIGRKVATALGFRYVNNEIIAWAADKAQVPTEVVDEVEHSTPLVRRILTAMATAGGPEIMEWSAAANPVLNPDSGYRYLIQDVIHETATVGKVVIVAHAASIFLAGMPGLLRVFVTASPETRAKRLAANEQITDQEARRKIEHSDRERRAYLKRFYALNQELPTHYDLVINTDELSPDAAVEAITSTAKAMA